MKIQMDFSECFEVGKSDIEFSVRNGSALFGTHTISQGSIDWRTKGARRGGPDECSMKWAEYARLIQLWHDGRVRFDTEGLPPNEKMGIRQFERAAWRRAHKRKNRLK